MTHPMLKQADWTKTFILRTDASSYVFPVVLLESIDKASEHPIEYASRLLTSTERNYSTTEREALAVVQSLEKMRGFVEVVVAMDHQSLKQLWSLKSLSGRLAFLAQQLQSFLLKIEYKSGNSNAVADMLSRLLCNHFCQSAFCQTYNFVSIDTQTRSPNDIREEQLKDENLKKDYRLF